MTLTPAFGRDYKSKAQVIADLNSGKDFVANSPLAHYGYISIRELGDGTVQVRNANLRNVWVITIKDGVAS